MKGHDGAAGGSASQRGEEPNDREERIAAIVWEYLDRHDAGEAIDATRILSEHPDVGPEILEHMRTFQSVGEPGQADGTLVTLGDYMLHKQLGRGGMGVVYDAWQKSMDRRVALKVLPAGIAADPRACARFLREAQAAGRLSHPSIVSVHAMGVEQGTPFYAMELVEGETLAQVLAHWKSGEQACGPFGSETDGIAFYQRIACAFAGAADGLEHAHSQGVIHRDIKPSNLMVEHDGRLRIVDFGLARVEGHESFTRTGEFLGTVLYMSPEQAMARRVLIDHRTDIYSLGATLYEILVGRPAFEGKDLHDTLTQIIGRETRPPRQLNQRIPRDLETIVLHAMEKDCGRRYASAAEVAADLRRFLRGEPIQARPLSVLGSVARKVWRHRRRVAIAAAFLLLAASFIGFGVRTYRREQAMGKLLPRISELIDLGEWEEAHELGLQAKAILGDDERLRGLMEQMTRTAESLATEPLGARVYWRLEDRPEADWRFLGVTPLTSFQIPRGYYQWRVENQGLPAFEFRLDANDMRSLYISMEAAARAPSRMVYVAGGTSQSLQHCLFIAIPPVDFRGFYADRYEVTNREFAGFVKEGGYENPAWWEEAVRECRVEGPWEEVVARFTDQTGRPGPATWRDGAYPEGKDDHPVSGVSWFEAAAFARSRGKRLPSAYHWAAAATPFQAAKIVPLSNIERGEPAPVGQYPGASAWGACDVAGNVKEWCWNDSGKGRFLLGGSSSDLSYMFVEPCARDPFDRAPDAGFRCIELVNGEEGRTELWGLVPLAVRDYKVEKPMADDEFRLIKEVYSYKAGPESLDERHEETAEEEHWVRERISFQAIYGNERVPIILFLPRGFRRPFQTLVFFPGLGSMRRKSSGKDGRLDQMQYVSFLARSGRAVVYPIYKGSYERAESQPAERWSWDQKRDMTYAFFRDLARSVDYLATRPGDFDAGKLGYYGVSLGAHVAPIFLALEPRFRAAVITYGGLPGWKEPRPIDKFHFAPRVTTPVLMLNGKFDTTFPYEESQRTLFDFLGTPPEHKEHKTSTSDHSVPMKDVIEESLQWLDRYFEKPIRETEVVR